MRTRFRPALGALLAVAFLLCACTGQGGPPGPRFAEVASQLPALAPDRARVFFYRFWEPYETLARPNIYLNGRVVGVSVPGGVFYRDVAPGEYLVSVDSTGNYWNQFKTVKFGPGDIRYIRIESLRSWDSGWMMFEADTFVVEVIDTAQAQGEMASLTYVTGE